MTIYVCPECTKELAKPSEVLGRSWCDECDEYLHPMEIRYDPAAPVEHIRH